VTSELYSWTRPSYPFWEARHPAVISAAAGQWSALRTFNSPSNKQEAQRWAGTSQLVIPKAHRMVLRRFCLALSDSGRKPSVRSGPSPSPAFFIPVADAGRSRTISEARQFSSATVPIAQAQRDSFEGAGTRGGWHKEVNPQLSWNVDPFAIALSS